MLQVTFRMEQMLPKPLSRSDRGCLRDHRKCIKTSLPTHFVSHRCLINQTARLARPCSALLLRSLHIIMALIASGSTHLTAGQTPSLGPRQTQLIAHSGNRTNRDHLYHHQCIEIEPRDQNPQRGLSMRKVGARMLAFPRMTRL